MTLSFYHDRISGIGKLEENWNCILKCKKKNKTKKNSYSGMQSEDWSRDVFFHYTI